MTVPMLDEMIQLAAANSAREVVIGMAHRGRLNVLAHNLGRAYETIFREFEGASSIEAVTTIPQGGTGDVKYHHGAQGTYQLPDDALDHRPAGVQPEPPRVRLAGRRGRHARGPDDAPGPARAPGRQRRDPDHPARRRGLPRPGRRGGDLQPAGARRLHRRRHAAPDPEQPGRLHDRPRRRALHALGLGPREGLRRPDHPRQRRRRGRLRLRRAARVRVPPGVRPRRRDRPDRLPPLRPQRGRRARLHAARDGGEDQEEDRRCARSTPASSSSAACSPRRRPTRSPRRSGTGSPTRHRELKEELAATDAEQPTGGYELDRSPSPEVKTAVSAERLIVAQRRAAAGPRGLHGPPEAASSSSSAGARRSAPTAASTGRRPRASPTRRC